MSIPALKIDRLKKAYKDVVAVDGVSFVVERGKIAGLLGPNGAGKTTTINMVLGLLEQTEGGIEIEGYDNKKDRIEALKRTNFAAVYAQVPGNLTVAQNLRIFGLLYEVKGLKEKIARLLREFNLEKFANTKCGLLSSGEMTRVNLAKSLINDPHLLLLDEPTASLDPASAQIIREKIRQFVRERNGGVLWTSHNMQEVAEMCDVVYFLSHGKILLSGNPRTLPQEHGKKDLEELFITVANEPLSLDI